jgi:hypothetical protein
VADKIRLEIGGRLAPILLRLAREQDRDPNEITEEALARYLQELGVEMGPGLGRVIREVNVEAPEEGSRDSFLALLSRMSSRFDLEEDEAERIAVEEQHTWRLERRERAQRERTER